MKQKSLFICLLLTAFLLSGCNTGNNSSSGKKFTKNEFLGEVPSINKEYKQKIDKKMVEIKECTDYDKSMKLREELKQVIAERDGLVDKSLAESLLKPVPFEPLDNMLYTINGIKISKAGDGLSLKVTFSVKTNENVTEYVKDKIVSWLYAYYSPIDKDGNVIANKKYMARNEMYYELKPDMEIELLGNWSIDYIGEDMNDFAKIRLITKEEYEAK